MHASTYVVHSSAYAHTESTYEPSRGSSLLSGDRGAPYMLQALAAWRADGWDSNDAPRQLVELDELERALTKQGEAESDLGLK